MTTHSKTESAALLYFKASISVALRGLLSKYIGHPLKLSGYSLGLPF